MTADDEIAARIHHLIDHVPETRQPAAVIIGRAVPRGDFERVTARLGLMCLLCEECDAPDRVTLMTVPVTPLPGTEGRAR